MIRLLTLVLAASVGGCGVCDELGSDYPLQTYSVVEFTSQLDEDPLGVVSVEVRETEVLVTLNTDEVIVFGR